MNPNLAKMQSAHELRSLMGCYQNPKTVIQGLILRGIQAELGIVPKDALWCGATRTSSNGGAIVFERPS